MIDVQAEPIDTLSQDLPLDTPTPIDEYRDRAVFNAGLFTDGGGHLIEAYSTLQGNDTVLRVFKTDHATGQRTPVADVSPPPGFKLDSAAISPSGGNLLVGMTAHEAISSPTRRNIYARALVPGVLVPYPGGAEPRGAWIDPALLGGSPAPNPSPEPTDPQAVAEAVLAVLTSDVSFHTMLQRYAKNGAREALAAEVQNENGALQFANAATFLRTQDGFLQVERDGLNQWVMDRVFQVLNENGLIHHTEPSQ